MARRKDSLMKDLYQLFIALPWWIGPVVAAALFGLFYYVVPLLVPSPAPGTSTSEVMSSTLVQVVAPLPAKLAPWLAGAVLFVWMASLAGKLSRRNLVATTREMEHLRALSWREFELLIGEYYRRQGFSVEERGSAGGDGGVDIALRKLGRLVLVQCKHWKKQRVGVQQVRELLGAMSHEKADSGVFAITGTFTPEARSLAEQNRIELLDGESLLRLVASVRQTPPAAPAPAEAKEPGASPPPSCPKCGSAMTLRTAQKGPKAGSQFYGCNRYPACRGTRTL